jgi:hypothetical protein
MVRPRPASPRRRDLPGDVDRPLVDPASREGLVKRLRARSIPEWASAPIGACTYVLACP